MGNKYEEYSQIAQVRLFEERIQHTCKSKRSYTTKDEAEKNCPKYQYAKRCLVCKGWHRVTFYKQSSKKGKCNGRVKLSESDAEAYLTHKNIFLFRCNICHFWHVTTSSKVLEAYAIRGSVKGKSGNTHIVNDKRRCKRRVKLDEVDAKRFAKMQKELVCFECKSCGFWHVTSCIDKALAECNEVVRAEKNQTLSAKPRKERCKKRKIMKKKEAKAMSDKHPHQFSFHCKLCGWWHVTSDLDAVSEHILEE